MNARRFQSIRWLKACGGLLLATLSTITHPLMGQPRPKEPLQIYQEAAQAMLDVEVMPRLLNSMSASDRERLGSFRAEVILSRDPTRLQLERESARSSRLVITAGFLSVQDVLIDAWAVATASNHERDLIDYSIEITRFALRSGYDGNIAAPPPFWSQIGWPAPRYQQLRTDRQTQELRYTQTLQALAWIVANAMAERLTAESVDDAARGLQSPKPQRARAGELLRQAHLPSVPAWPVVLFVNALQSPDEGAATHWICATRDASADASAPHGINQPDPLSARERALRENTLGAWRETTEMLSTYGKCASVP